VIAGERRLKRALSPEPIVVKMSPITQDLMVEAGTSCGALASITNIL